VAGCFDGRTQLFVDLNGYFVAGLCQHRGDGEKWIEVSGCWYRSNKNFHKLSLPYTRFPVNLNTP
jgi:hypothetical protein